MLTELQGDAWSAGHLLGSYITRPAYCSNFSLKKSVMQLSSPDHRSVRNKEVKFLCICSLGQRFRFREGLYYRSLKKKSVRILLGHSVPESARIREVSVRRGSTVQHHVSCLSPNVRNKY